jgi:hypothetical protein
VSSFFLKTKNINSSQNEKNQHLLLGSDGAFFGLHGHEFHSQRTSSPEAVQFLSDLLGYPKYIIPFLGVAKILGAVVLLIPSLRRVKEWAYAGFFFDLVGATYSIIAVEGFKPQSLFMGVFIGFLFLSYFLWHKKLEATPLFQSSQL